MAGETIQVRMTPNDDKTFTCFVNGWLEYLKLDEIKRRVARGADLKEWK